MQTLSVARLFEDQRQELQLEQLTESLASAREITVSDIHRPGMALMGFVENFLPERIQIMAQTELTYLATLPPEGVRAAIEQATERLEQQIRRLKERLVSRKRNGQAREAAPIDSSSVTGEDILEEYFDEPADGTGQGGFPRGE